MSSLASWLSSLGIRSTSESFCVAICTSAERLSSSKGLSTGTCLAASCTWGGIFGMSLRQPSDFHSRRISHDSACSPSSHVFALSMLVAVISGIGSTSFIGSLHAVELCLCRLTIPGAQHDLAPATFTHTRQRDLIDRVAPRVLEGTFEAQHQLTHRTLVRSEERRV